MIFMLAQLFVGVGYAWNKRLCGQNGCDLSSVPYQYTVLVDKWMTSRSGADLSLSLIELYRNVEDRVLNDNRTGLLSPMAVNILKFPLRFIAISEIVIIQHEIFGHGSRARELDIDVGNYKIGFLYGSTSYKHDATLPLQKHISLYLGGISGTHVLGERIKQSFFEADGVINPVRGIGYALSQGDQIQYSFSDYGGSGHDIKKYMDDMNKIYGKNFLTEGEIKRAALISAVDPFLFLSLYSFITDQNIVIPMFKIGELKYLPALRSIFTPYGIETKLLNHFIKGDMYGQINLSYGNNKSSKSYSVEANIYNLWMINKLTFNVELALWRQPELFLDRPLKASNKLGGSFNLISEYPFTNKVKVFASLGYKTKGYKSELPPMETPLAQIGIEMLL